MTSPWIKFGSEFLNVRDLERQNLPGKFTQHESHVIQLCIDWESGKETFEFQTSGSTGAAKKIEFSRGQLEASARLTEHALNLQRGYTALVCLDTRLIAGAMMVVRSLVTGMNMVVRTPLAVPLNETTEQIDFAALVPYQVSAMLESVPGLLKRISIVIVGGATISGEIRNQLKTFTTSVHATYGMTETISHIALQRLSGPEPVDQFECLEGIKVSTDDRGCLIIRAAHLGPGPIITNDLVTLIDHRRFRWIGRFDRIINSGGAKVSPERVEGVLEAVLSEVRPMLRFFVAGLPDEKLGEKVVVVVEGQELTPKEKESIKNYLTSRLEKYELPRTYLSTLRFAETPSQKVDWKRTVAMLLTN